jgi:hypothetical protein
MLRWLLALRFSRFKTSDRVIGISPVTLKDRNLTNQAHKLAPGLTGGLPPRVFSARLLFLAVVADNVEVATPLSAR